MIIKAQLQITYCNIRRQLSTEAYFFFKTHTFGMATRDFDNAILRQALRQTLIDVLDATALEDRDVSMLRYIPRNTFDHRFPSQLDFGRPPSLQLGDARASSLHTFLGGLAAPAYNIFDSALLAAAEQAKRQHLGEAQVAVFEKHQVLINEAQKRNTFFKQQESYNEFLRGMAPSQQTPAHSYVTTGVELMRAQAPANVNKVLNALGSSIRGKTDRYIDVSGLKIPTEEEQPLSVRGGVAEPFPMKLYRMLQEVEEAGKSHIVSFYSHGRAFGIHDINAFTYEILPKYFSKQSKRVSFVRQLNLYGFVRIHSGPDVGGYYHELFLKGRPELFLFMRRTGASSKGKEDRRKCKDRNVPAIQSDFYAMPPIRPREER
jgi:hypothetical protein